MLFVSSLELVQFMQKLREINRKRGDLTPPPRIFRVFPGDSHPLPNIIIALRHLYFFLRLTPQNYVLFIS